MTNPFDKMTQSEKYNFYDEMTTAINKWMLETYPDFDTKLAYKIRMLESRADSLDKEIERHTEAMKMQIKQAEDFFRKGIEQWMKKDYPTFSVDFTQKMKILNELITDYEKDQKKIAANIKKIYTSNSLYEDFYKFKDELDKMKKYIENFQASIKKAF